jgi:hypothetical protein
MRTAHNPAGRALGIPVALKRHRVGGGGGLRSGKLGLRAEHYGGKEKKTNRGPGAIAEDAGETRKTGALPRTDTFPTQRYG